MRSASLAYRLALTLAIFGGVASVGRGQGVVAEWTFPSGSLSATTGTGTASLVGGTMSSAAGGLLTSDSTGGLSVTGFPAANTGSGTAGVQFVTSTSGANNTNIVVRFDILTSASASRFYRLDYTTDGTNYTAGDVFSVAPNSGGRYNPNQTFNLSGVGGLGNNANFGFRIVSVFDPAGSNYSTTNSGGTYQSISELRLDNTTVSAAHVYTGGSGSLTSGAKYAGGNAPTTTGTVLFTNAGGSVTLPTGTTNLGQVVFDPSAGAYTVDPDAAPRTLKLAGGVVNQSASNQSVRSTLNLTSGPQTITNAGAGTLTLRNLTLANTNNQSDEAQLTLAGTGRIVVSGSVGGNSTSGELAIRKVGTATTLLNGSSSFGGNVAIDSGRLGGLGNVAGAVTVAPGATVLGGDGSTTISGTKFQIGTDLTLGNGASMELSVANGGAANDLTNAGASRITLPGTLIKASTGDAIGLIVNVDGSIDLSGLTAYSRRLITYGTLDTTGFGATANTATQTYTDASPGPFSLSGTNLTSGAPISFPSWSLTIGGPSHLFDLTFTPTPEPTTVFGLVAGVMALAGVVRRRRRSE